MPNRIIADFLTVYIHNCRIVLITIYVGELVANLKNGTYSF